MRSLFALACFASVATAAPSYDVIVYGGTSGGVTAAVQAARSGDKVLLIAPEKHLGGLTSSGLGWTDLGDSGILGGLSREFYHLIYQHYANPEAWTCQTREQYGNHGQKGPAFHDEAQIASVFEPKVAEAAFNRLVKDAEVPVVHGFLDLVHGVVMDGRRIRSLRLVDGREFAGRMFIDASYEGDLLPGAGVTFTVGREPNATYNETYSGIQTKRALKNQLPAGIDPYVTPGDSASGLLPGVESGPAGPDGNGDKALQAYCFRMVLTDDTDNRVAIGKPEEYRDADYELLFRAIEAGQDGNFFKLDLMPNRKTDSNNTGGISTDFIGRNWGPDWDWTTLDHEQRAALAKEHENWQRGLVWTLQNHPRVPEKIRRTYARWGLPKDEFPDNNHWPYQLYVREARRMVSDLVMTQAHCEHRETMADPVGLAAYAMDSHHVRRQVVDGMVRNEGDVQMQVRKPYPVSYRSIVPKRGECENLLVPWSLSASHMAFGSIRMEPVFMTLAQSAAIAAHESIQRGGTVQDLPYPILRTALKDAGIALGTLPEPVKQVTPSPEL
ncbi:MAG: FAD-dependent oxidoreductase [Akkermansiaceae bacterium]|nr:FAD-dependent oxidoreductase [Akkermansiaceae bacterium]